MDVIQNVALEKKSEMCFCQDCENQPIFSEELSLNDNENEDTENGIEDILTFIMLTYSFYILLVRLI